MKLTKKSVFGILVLLAGALVGGYYITLWRFKASLGRAIAHEFSEHALPSPDAKAWAQIQVGMTKQQVISLLGDSRSKMMPAGKEESWEYGYTLGLIPLEAPQAYIVRFGPEGKVSSFRSPVPSVCELPSVKQEPNQSPEPTPTTVTPPAGRLRKASPGETQEARQP